MRPLAKGFASPRTEIRLRLARWYAARHNHAGLVGGCIYRHEPVTRTRWVADDPEYASRWMRGETEGPEPTGSEKDVTELLPVGKHIAQGWDAYYHRMKKHIWAEVGREEGK